MAKIARPKGTKGPAFAEASNNTRVGQHGGPVGVNFNVEPAFRGGRPFAATPGMSTYAMLKKAFVLFRSHK